MKLFSRDVIDKMFDDLPVLHRDEDIGPFRTAEDEIAAVLSFQRDLPKKFAAGM